MGGVRLALPIGMSSLQDSKLIDPKGAEPKPPFPKKTIELPGLESEMPLEADHGEETYRGSGRLQGRRALITGGDSGIGRAVAIAFAREGADVAISCLPEEAGDAAETERWVRQAGVKALVLPGDIQVEKHCDYLIQQTVNGFGSIDILVNNAAFQITHESIDEFTAEEFDRTFRTNVYAMFFLSRAAMRVMKPGSVILNTTSIQAFVPSPNLLSYSPTKAAIANFTKGLAQTAIAKGIRVNGVAPGPVWTPLIPSTMPADKVAEFGKTALFERPAQPVELAPLYVFLASNEARYVTGEIYGATGGKMPL